MCKVELNGLTNNPFEQTNGVQMESTILDPFCRSSEKFEVKSDSIRTRDTQRRGRIATQISRLSLYKLFGVEHSSKKVYTCCSSKG